MDLQHFQVHGYVHDRIFTSKFSPIRKLVIFVHLDLGVPKVRLLIHNAAHVGAKGSFLDSELGAVGMVVLNRWVGMFLTSL